MRLPRQGGLTMPSHGSTSIVITSAPAYPSAISKGKRRAVSPHLSLHAFSTSTAPPPLIASSSRHGPACSTSRASSQPCFALGQRRGIKDHIRYVSPNGSSARVPLKAGSVFGLSTSRGSRAYQEDTSSVSCISIPSDELRSSMAQSSSRILQEAARFWSKEKAGDEVLASQVVWFGVYDGHGGQSVSSFLRDHLHEMFEAARPNMATDTAEFTRSLGGYFRRFTGGAMSRWVREELLTPLRSAGARNRARALAVKAAKEAEGQSEASVQAPPAVVPPSSSGEKQASKLEKFEVGEDRMTRLVDPPEEVKGQSMTLAERATLAWLMADRKIQANEELNKGGSTASVALLHSLDSPAQPWYSSSLLSVTACHVGDTRLLLCAVEDGRAIPLTNYHHPDDRAEADRLRRVGAGMITDSFGEARWMGALANTRAFGDSGFKKAGVTAEPEVISQVIKGDAYAFIIGFSDGVGGVLSDQEIVDLCRGANHPSDAAKAVLNFAEDLGSEDNGTVLVIPLKGWGKVKGEDTTRERRDYRKSKTDVFRERRQ